ncbi:hypothetical protein [Microbacterium sp. T32]|uniref:hypothetical protein n=1 Tax=Microbacterium sp. T32 TaxID=1776083 RepID=UPI0007AC05E1|nr:hypothetical protein [Microbacterium sp. T32]KZE42057.1 hypothetical protein AVW09_11060 [Microbacterium sp. T32]
MAIHTPKTREDLARLLDPMRLEATPFEHAVAVGAAEKRTVSPAAPKSGPEYTRWMRTVEALHEGLMLLRRGWRRDDPDNLPYFSHPQLRLGLVASSGGKFTGVAWGNPSTKNDKGVAFARRVDLNGQVALFDQPTGDGGSFVVDDLWILLYNERDGMVYLELSHPMSMTGKKIDTWSERIIFPPFDLALGAFSFEEIDDEDEGDVGFTVTRR